MSKKRKHKEDESIASSTTSNQNWNQQIAIPCGLENSEAENQCYLNSVLQVLTFLPGVYNLLYANQHLGKCKLATFCLLCEMIKHVERVRSGSAKVYRPVTLIKNINLICKQFQPGQQEDFIECFEAFVFKLGSTFYEQFQGEMLHSISCQECGFNKYDTEIFQTIQLPLKDNDSTDFHWSLQEFFKSQIVHGYKCSSCHKKVEIEKCYKLHRPPKIITVQFNRFRSTGGKNMNLIEYPETFNTAAMMRSDYSSYDDVQYFLNAVIIHDGRKVKSGHYFVYVKLPTGLWFLLDDTEVVEVEFSSVLSDNNAYVCIYQQDQVDFHLSESNNTAGASTSNRRCVLKTKSESKKRKLH